MKRLIVGTTVGRVALAARDLVGRAYAAIANPEIAGAVANDYIAAFLVTRLCKDSAVFLDVGAHIGSIVAEVARQCPKARIVAFEAIPEKVDHLRHRFPRVELHGVALSDWSGTAPFHVHRTESGYSSLGKPRVAGETVEINVPVRQLDEIPIDGRVDVMKIDVEGAELGVLRGGEQLIAENRPTIMFESDPSERDGLGFSQKDIWQWFSAREYSILVPNRLAHNGDGLSIEGFIESHWYPRRTTNYFAVANERRVEIRDRVRRIMGTEAPEDLME